MIGPTVTMVFVNWKTAGLGTPDTMADTVNEPTVPLAVKSGEVATPAALVVAVTVVWPPAKTPLGPLTGALKVTVTPDTGLLPASATVADKAAGYCVLIGAL